MADPLKQEKKFSKEDLAQAEVIDSLSSPEEVKAARELFNEDLAALHEPETDTSLEGEKEPKKAETLPEVTKVEGEETKAGEEKPVETKPQLEKPKETEIEAVVDDKFIEKYPEEDRKILEKYKGKPISELAKALVNAQRLVGKKTIQEPTSVEKFYKDGQAPIAAQVDDETEIQKLVTQRLRQSYADFPEDVKEQKAYIDNVASEQGYTSAQELIDSRKEITSEIRDAYSKLKFVEENYGAINKHALEQEAVGIQQEMEEILGVSDLSAFGVDLNFDDQGRNAIISQLMVDGTGQLDPNLFYTIYGSKKPLVKPGAFIQKFIRLNAKDIRTKRDTQIRDSARKEVVESQQKKPVDVVTPSGDKGTVIKKDFTTDDVDKLSSLDDIRKLKGEMKVKIVS